MCLIVEMVFFLCKSPLSPEVPCRGMPTNPKNAPCCLAVTVQKRDSTPTPSLDQIFSEPSGQWRLAPALFQEEAETRGILQQQCVSHAESLQQLFSIVVCPLLLILASFEIMYGQGCP